MSHQKDHEAGRRSDERRPSEGATKCVSGILRTLVMDVGPLTSALGCTARPMQRIEQHFDQSIQICALASAGCWEERLSRTHKQYAPLK